MIRLERVTGKNAYDIMELKVRDDQRGFVADNTLSLAEAYVAVTGGGYAFPFGIYDGETPVGFLMIGYGRDEYWTDAPAIAKNNYSLWRLMIDRRYQGRGFGREALRLALELIKSMPCGTAEYCWLSYEPENTAARELYRSFGFAETGDTDGDEVIAALRLSPAPGTQTEHDTSTNGDDKMVFNAEKTKNDVVEWIRGWFEQNGRGCNAVIGISGGKDSSVTAALCAEALGRERVVGVLMPNGEQFDIDVAKALVAHLGIKHYIVNIRAAYEGIMSELEPQLEVQRQTVVNLPPRLRMSALYAVSQSLNGRVANTCNLSEDWVGYSTRYGDSAGDFSPLARLTVAEVKAVGRALGLPAMFVDKPPIDGLCGKTDEDNLGFTYAVLDRYIREGICEDAETKAKIDRMRRNSRFKLELMPAFEYGGPILAADER